MEETRRISANFIVAPDTGQYSPLAKCNLNLLASRIETGNAEFADLTLADGFRLSGHAGRAFPAGLQHRGEGGKIGFVGLGFRGLIGLFREIADLLWQLAGRHDPFA